MVCRLCLIEYGANIAIFGEEQIQGNITKFLQLHLTPDDPVSKVICNSCWQNLENFQTFYTRVQDAQKNLSNANCRLKSENSLDDSDQLFKDCDANLLQCDTILETNCLKTEYVTTPSDDEVFEGADSSQYIDDNIVKFELESDEKPNIDIPPSRNHDIFSTRRLTRGAKLKQLSFLQEELQAGIAKNTECRRESYSGNGKDSDVSAKVRKVVQIQRGNQTGKDMQATRKRGRPKKGEERPKTIKVRTEKGEKIQETAREFDEIIKKNMKLVCNICSINLVDFAELKRHFRAIHNRKGYAVCCNKRLYKRGLVVDHINTHNNPEYFKCPVCGKIMADRMCLRNHTLLLHQNDDDKAYQCAYCPKKYAKQYLLDHHQVKHIPQEECSFFCEECGKGFPTKSTLSQHINQIHSTIYDKMCEICAKLIRGNAAFDRHMDEHEGIVQPQVQCEICGSWLKDKNSLRKHMYKHDGKSYTCDICGKIAQTKSALQSHQRYVHEALRKFHCTFCDKSFKKAVNLREHLTTHTGEILYTCPHCPKTFNSKANMHSHRKKKHREEWEANRRYKTNPITATEVKPALS